MNTSLNDELIDDDSWKDAGTIDDLVRELLQESDETAHLYLRESWISSVLALLRSARRVAGLTQQELADRLGMKQSAIARLERAEDTKLSTVWKYLAASGQAPADLQTVSLKQLRQFALADPGALRTVQAVDSWKLRSIFEAPGGRRPHVSIDVTLQAEPIDAKRLTAPGRQASPAAVAA